MSFSPVPQSVSMFSSVFEDTSTPELWSSDASSLFGSTYGSPFHACSSLEYVVNHVFFPVFHPQRGDYTPRNAHALAGAVHAAACFYSERLDHFHRSDWFHVIKMLEDLQVLIDPAQPWNDSSPNLRTSKIKLHSSHPIFHLAGMKDGDIVLFPAASHHDAAIFRRHGDFTLYGSFQISGYPTGCCVVAPGTAIQVPHKVFYDEKFLHQLAHLRSDMSTKPLTKVLHGFGCLVHPKPIAKHAGPSRIQQSLSSHRSDWNSSEWSRSALWFLIKATIYSSLDHSPLGHGVYKAFLLFYMCKLADYALNTSPPSVLLHSMSAKILRRFTKLSSRTSTPQWLSNTVYATCNSIARILDQRQREVRCSSPLWDPSRLDFTMDIHLSFLPIERISSALTNRNVDSQHVPFKFLPNCRRRDTLDNFLSVPDELFARPNHLPHYDDFYIILYDAEQAVANGIDDWFACVANIGEACKDLERLAHQYQSSALDAYCHREDMYDADHHSIMFLTMIELWVTLDKLVVSQIPILADYSPEIPIGLLCKILLRDAISIHRLGRAYQYLLARHNQAHPRWSALSSEFTKDSFPCRYYDTAPPLHFLRAHIQGNDLPTDPLHAKVVLFELQCPVLFDSWRSVTCLLSRVSVDVKAGPRDVPVCDVPALQPHIPNQKPSLTLYASPRRRNRPLDVLTPHHVAQDSRPPDLERLGAVYYVHEGPCFGRFEPVYKLPSGPYVNSRLQRYLDDTKHTSNEVLAFQAYCHPNLSLPEFVAFAHLRSGGSLQWVNILRELRSRTLDFRHQEIFLLLAQASAQTGPIDTTGDLAWHQEIQDTSFCYALLGELESLFTDIGFGSLDGPAMAIISLLAGALASRSPGNVSEQAFQLLRDVREKTFEWVHELLYTTRMSPSKVGYQLLRDMAAVCRGTFDMGSSTNHQPLLSPRDIEIALSCAMIIRMAAEMFPVTSEVPPYSHVLLNRNRRLSFLLEGNLRDSIQADVSDIGVDRAIQMIWSGYRPTPHRWRPLQSPNSRWLVCETASTTDRLRHTQVVQINLLDGSVLVDGKPIGNRLPSDITQNSMYRELFGDRDLLVVPSDIPGMDFVTVSAVDGYFVHFVVRASNSRRIVIRAQNKLTGHTFELIPRERLQKHLPRPLVENCLHWLNLGTSVIEIRPIGEPWKQSSDNWRIDLQPGQSRARKGSDILISKLSPTWTMVSGRLCSLDDRENLVVTATLVDSTQSPTSLRLSASLPRYGLSFFVNEVGQLESRDFRNMVYDDEQCIGTLHGLVNKLVLCPKADIEANIISKSIIIPYGHPFNRRNHKVYVNFPSSGQVSYYTYQADNELGCLKGIVSMESRVYLAHLHALTGSECRPDPLTGRTGVEEAISLLWLAGARQQTHECSFTSLSPQIRLAFAKLIQNHTDWELPSGDALQREACLFSSEVPASAGVSRKGSFESLDQLLHGRPAPSLRERNMLPRYSSGYNSLPANDTNSLRQLFSSLRTSETAPPFQSQYVSRLHSSAHRLQTTDSIRVGCESNPGTPDTDRLRKHYVQCRTSYSESLDMIKVALGPKTEFESILDRCGQWPPITPFVLFRCLASTSPVELPENWKKCLISLALLALDIQRARRLLQFCLDNLEEELYRELENEGCDGWDATKQPDWLLIQLQGNFLIRRVQADVANEMLSPRSDMNTVMQVNMGEGKTSVILPICAATLADGNRLVRIIVPKPLVPQTFQVLTDRLGGLIDKPIYHLTFSREDMKARFGYNWFLDGVGHGKVDILHALVRKCRDQRGIIVMQPEHTLSLKLACVEVQLGEPGIMNEIKKKPILGIPKRWLNPVLGMLKGSFRAVKSTKSALRVITPQLASGKGHEHETPEKSISSDEVGITNSKQDIIMELQRFLETHARDILDECDHVLRPQFQLIYVTGHQYPFEESPQRWLLVQQVLGLIKRHSHFLSTCDSRTIRCDTMSPGSFPHIHILQADVGQQIISLTAQDILDGHLLSINLHSELGLRGAILEFLLHEDIHTDTARMVEQYARQTTSLGSLLLMRGLFAYNILLFALTQRRWRVDYGLDPASPPRTMLAIPYRAKDVPAESAEFGHPDITVLLTCLSYYYAGLSEEQLRISFEHLLQGSDPSSEYALWLEDCDIASVPNALRKLGGVNIRSLEQWNEYLVPLFTRNKRAIDVYLSEVVFAKHAKDFPQRIAGSYWDLAERRNHLVTGFSGTNDGQYLLPTSITQDDPDHLHQAGTNAKILAYLLQPENSSYMVTADSIGERWSTIRLLEMIVAQNLEIRVLLDVGAQILDLSNLELAKAWLDCTQNATTDGAIFFSEDDELMVLTRDGAIQSLSSSPLIQQLHRCVAYLDDAHTRGTDIPFPRGFRAAVTLGRNVTKDRLVQGCMRMRRLGHGHSVMFLAPHEVDQSIRCLAAKENEQVTIADILRWAIHETWAGIQRQAAYWAQQGMCHQSRYDAWSRFCRDSTWKNQLAVAWVQPELKSLADLYMPHSSPGTISLTKLPRKIRERCENLGVLSLPDARMDKEQEREVSRQIERERLEIERPFLVTPAVHSLHPDVIHFAKTGMIPSPFESEAFNQLFATGVTATHDKPHSWSPHILATADFCKTITEKRSPKELLTDYARPIQWILSAKSHGMDALVLLSPFEVDLLMPEIRISNHVHLHLYIPRTTERMIPADDLRLYSIPPVPSDWIPPWNLIDQLNVFAGQLYLSDYASYLRLCRFLGIHAEYIPRRAGTVVARNWFRNPTSLDSEIKDRFEGTLLPQVIELLVGRRGMHFARTHMGKILDGLPLIEEDFVSHHRFKDAE